MDSVFPLTVGKVVSDFFPTDLCIPLYLGSAGCSSLCLCSVSN